MKKLIFIYFAFGLTSFSFSIPVIDVIIVFMILVYIIKLFYSKKFWLFIWNYTHRVKYCYIQGPLCKDWRYAPQFWFGWWHYKGYELVNQREILISFNTEYEAYEDLYKNSSTISQVMSEEEIQGKLDYYKKKELIDYKIKKLEEDFV